ncbi:chemotaxis protein CheW [Reinekea sp.]|uniref:chemotaxis protein CheW n=1 Tax=Reinekea sp. TaxID=1970455 RepID=UPI002369C6CF|nr:chemotaxis protein CheW [Reinekea sp.]MDB9894636.1 chemotaxis protein CheW [Reinekea forsetii]
MADNCAGSARTQTAPSTTARVLTAYLDALLHDATAIDPERTGYQNLARQVGDGGATSVPSATPPQPEIALSSAAAPLFDWPGRGQPAWARQRFDCLVFTVNGLKLAVPLRMLSTIYTVDKKLTPLFDQPSWFLGLLPGHQGQSVRVVDTALMVMPERNQPKTKAWVRFAIGVHDSDWAFAAQGIKGSISLVPEAVKWRTQRTSRPWLAGTVISELCALVDPDAFEQLVRG